MKKKTNKAGLTDYLSQDEVHFSKHAAKELQDTSWATKLLNEPKIVSAINHIPKPGISLSEKLQLKSAYFEIRFAYALHRRGLQPIYEYSAGIGNTTIDFNINSTPNWLVELTSLNEGEAVKAATTQGNNGITTYFSQTIPGQNSPEVVDIIRAQRAICSKVVDNNNNSIKFSQLPSNSFHMIILDARSYNAGISDAADYINIAYGSELLMGIDYGFLTRYWVNQDKKQELIKGLFALDHPEPKSRFIRERIHALGFVAETKYEDDFIIQNLAIMHNHHLFNKKDDFLSVLPSELQKR